MFVPYLHQFCWGLCRQGLGLSLLFSGAFRSVWLSRSTDFIGLCTGVDISVVGFIELSEFGLSFVVFNGVLVLHLLGVSLTLQALLVLLLFCARPALLFILFKGPFFGFNWVIVQWSPERESYSLVGLLSLRLPSLGSLQFLLFNCFWLFK